MIFTSLFTLPEMLSLLGLTQSVYVLVYMLVRSGSFKHALIPAFYFAFLGAGFFLDAAAGHWSAEVTRYQAFSWFFWFGGIPLGTLLILQVAQVTTLPTAKYYSLLAFIPLTLVPSFFFDEPLLMYVSGLVCGTISLLTIWVRKELLGGLHDNPRFGEERFWLILSLIILNTAFLGSTLAYVSHGLDLPQWMLVRTFLGIAFVYIAATSLFRIYPQALKLDRQKTGALSMDDQNVIKQLEILFQRDKIYQDAAFGRAELARELNTGEANLSRLVNIHYNKTIPQILNEYRVKDAQKLLKETDVPIQNVFEESGFNSITTFNRVFKDLTNEAPKEYRARFRA